MAERRMFAKSIVLSDAFLDMPMSARCLYFTLGMLADDDGFVGSPKSIMRQCGASQDDMAILLSKRYILGFESGIIVIKHWRMNNYLQNDRHTKTNYVEEFSTLMLDEKGAYTEREKGMYTKCIQNVYTGKDSIGKNSIDKNSKDNNKSELELTYDAFYEHRKKLKKPMTEDAKKLLHKKVDSLTDLEEEKIELLNEAMLKGWLSVYPPKDKSLHKKKVVIEEENDEDIDALKQELKEMFNR